MRVLVVKTSSLGDLIHTFPALTDAVGRIDGIRFDWLVEEAFTEVPGWHPAVERVVPIALRRWRRGWRKAWRAGDLQDFRRSLQQDDYDVVIDAQGLLKSAIPARWVRGPLVGYDRRSAREPLAALFYRQRVAVSRDQHAIERTRRLFASALGYPAPNEQADYGLSFPRLSATERPRLVLLHGTTWPSKHWPEPYWAELIALAGQEAFDVCLPWGDPDDRLRAERLIRMAGSGRLLPRQSLTQLAQFLASSTGVVGVDSGLAHLAAAVGTPAVTLYGPTRVALTGAVGRRQHNLAADFACAPCMSRECVFRGDSRLRPACFEDLSPARVLAALRQQMEAPAG